MKKKLINLVKYSGILYNIYFYVFSIFLTLIKLFIKTDPQLILINSFGGKKYDDSPKAIYERIKKDERFSNHKFVWAFHSPELYHIEGAKVVKTDTFRYYITALKARCWITNSGIERGLNFKGKNTFYFNTWHGTPIKKMGTDLTSDNKSFKSKHKFSADIMTVQGDYEAEVFSRAFNIPHSRLLKCGLPRNDIFSNYTTAYYNELKKKLNIPTNKKIILYAPTFREYSKDSMHNCILIPPIDLKKWESTIGNEYILLFRAHYEVSKHMKITDTEFIRDMTNYPSLEDLMVISDILISDYSSIFFDYSIMDKPMLHFTYDYNDYSQNRGMYFDIRKYINGSDNEDDLLKIIKTLSFETEILKTTLFRDSFVNYYGNSSAQCVEYIANSIL